MDNKYKCTTEIMYSFCEATWKFGDRWGIIENFICIFILLFHCLLKCNFNEEQTNKIYTVTPN